MEKRGKELSRQDNLITNEDEFFEQFPPSRVKKLLGDAKEHITEMEYGWNLDAEIVYVSIEVAGSKVSEMVWQDNDEFNFVSFAIDGLVLEEQKEVYKPMVILQLPVTKQYVRQSIKELGRKVEQYYKEINDKQ